MREKVSGNKLAHTLIQNLPFQRSKMNYRAWNHRCWLVSFMTREQVKVCCGTISGLFAIPQIHFGIHVIDSSI